MFGPEWTNDEPGDRDDSTPLTPEAEPRDAPTSKSNTVKIPTKAQSQPPEPAMAHAQASSDHDESDSSGTSASARPRKPLAILSTILGLLSKIPLPSMGSERHEMILDAPRTAASTTATATAETPPRASKRKLARLAFLGLKRETRVGLAAVLSFALLVTAMLFNKGWLGGKQPITLAMATPGDPEKKPEPKKEVKNEKKPGDPDKGSESTPRSDGARPPLPAPGDDPPATLAKDGPPKAGDQELPPSVAGEAPKATLLGTSTEPTGPPALPDETQSRPPVLPSQPTEALPLPGDQPTGSEPSGLPEVPKSAAPETPPVPTPASGPPSMSEPGSTTPPTPEKTEGTQSKLESPAAPPPLTNPAPPATVASEPPPTPTPARAEPTPPVRSDAPPTLESVPAGNSPSASPSDSVQPTAALGAGFVVVPSGGRRVVGASPLVSSPSESSTSAPIRAIDNPRGSDDLASADQLEPVLHRVMPGENFWSISKLYYRSGRFYRALHAANQRQVPNIRELYVGTVLRIPPPEALDRSLIDPPTRPTSRTDAQTAPTSTSTASRNSNRAEPVEEADLALPVRPRISRPEPDAEPSREPRRPTYTVKPFETLRSIARDTLNDPKRDREIYNLNRDVLDDPSNLPAGTILTLPEDARVITRAR
jgi:nucleoid-associated protein YgaU